MRRFLRLVLLCLVALALPMQGALAAAGVGMHATTHRHMTPPGGTAVHASEMLCHAHAADKTGACGACCGPIASQRAPLAVAPTAARWTSLPRAVAPTARAQFVTGGTERPPRSLLA